jgi:hypothetical protein
VDLEKKAGWTLYLQPILYVCPFRDVIEKVRAGIFKQRPKVEAGESNNVPNQRLGT